MATKPAYDAEYLKENVGGPLAKALASCAIANPPDPIEYIALWLMQFVKKSEKEAQLRNDAIELEEERKQYIQNLEYERMRLEEEQKEREEKIQKEREQKEAKRLQQITNLHHLLDNLPTENIHPIIAHLTAIRNELIQLREDEFFSLVTNVITPQTADPLHIRIVRAVLFMLDYKKVEFYKQTRLVRLITKTLKQDLKKKIVSYSPLSKQTTLKFQLIAGLLHGLGRKQLLQHNPPYIVVLMFEWVTACLNARRGALQLKRSKAGTVFKEEPELDPETEDDEEDDEDEQESLEPYLVVQEPAADAPPAEPVVNEEEEVEEEEEEDEEEESDD